MPNQILAPRAAPTLERLSGRFIALEKVDPAQHAQGLERHLCGAENEGLWDHIPYPAPSDSEALLAILARMEREAGWFSFAMRDLASADVTGTLSLMRIRPEHGSAEVGCVVFGRKLQRTRAATEAIYLLAEYLFGSLEYRRFEWKCDVLNQASRRAAARFGFSYEGIFRNDMIVKGRSRDTAWFAMTDGDWARLKPAYETWLADPNFDEHGAQLLSLKDLVAQSLER